MSIDHDDVFHRNSSVLLLFLFSHFWLSVSVCVFCDFVHCPLMVMIERDHQWQFDLANLDLDYIYILKKISSKQANSHDHILCWSNWSTIADWHFPSTFWPPYSFIYWHHCSMTSVIIHVCCIHTHTYTYTLIMHNTIIIALSLQLKECERSVIEPGTVLNIQAQPVVVWCLMMVMVR